MTWITYRRGYPAPQSSRRFSDPSALEAGHHKVPDDSVLSFAAEQGRIVVSHDRRTMPVIFAHFIGNRTSPGLIIVSRKLSVATAADWLYLIWSASEAEEYVNTIYTIP